MFPERLEDIENYYPDSPVSLLEDPWLEQYGIEIHVKRDDLIDPRVSGNKFRKLKYALSRYHRGNYSGIVSFGGAWSNYLHALSSIAEKYDIPNVAIVRGEEPKSRSATLDDIIQSGTKIHYVSRSDYRQFRTFYEQDEFQQHSFFEQWHDFMILPEGGYSNDALSGVADIIAEVNQEFNAIYVACGTGATLAGLSLGLASSPETNLTGIAVLRAGRSLEQNVQRLLSDYKTDSSTNWIIDDNYHFGGYAKINAELIDFINQLYERSGLITEPVYTGKCIYGLYQHIQQERFRAGSKILFVHTGGLQGLRGFRNRGLEQLTSAAGYL